MEILKAALSYNTKTNKIQISCIIENCILYGEYIEIKEEGNKKVSLQDVEKIIEATDYVTYNFTFYSFKSNMQEAEKKLLFYAFEFFSTVKDDKAVNKIASYIKVGK